MLFKNYIEVIKKILNNITTGNVNVTLNDYLFAVVGTFLAICSILLLLVAIYLLILGPKKIYNKYIFKQKEEYAELKAEWNDIYTENKYKSNKKTKEIDEILEKLNKLITKRLVIFIVGLSLIYIPILLPLILILLSAIELVMVIPIIGISLFILFILFIIWDINVTNY